jgi:hypothetical protein
MERRCRAGGALGVGLPRGEYGLVGDLGGGEVAPGAHRAGGAEAAAQSAAAWLETQTVRRPAAWAISTASTTAPSAARNPHFTVPSRETARASGDSAQNGSAPASRSRSARGSAVASSQPPAPARWASAAWRAR